MLPLDFIRDLVGPPYVLVPINEALDHSDSSLHLATSHLLLGLPSLTVARLGAEALDDSVDEHSADAEHSSDLLGCGFVCIVCPFDLK